MDGKNVAEEDAPHDMMTMMMTEAEAVLHVMMMTEVEDVVEIPEVGLVIHADMLKQRKEVGKIVVEEVVQEETTTMITEEAVVAVTVNLK